MKCPECNKTMIFAGQARDKPEDPIIVKYYICNPHGMYKYDVKAEILTALVPYYGDK